MADDLTRAVDQGPGCCSSTAVPTLAQHWPATLSINISVEYTGRYTVLLSGSQQQLVTLHRVVSIWWISERLVTVVDSLHQHCIGQCHSMNHIQCTDNFIKCVLLVMKDNWLLYWLVCHYNLYKFNTEGWDHSKKLPNYYLFPFRLLLLLKLFWDLLICDDGILI
jgi:hypothetical protein